MKKNFVLALIVSALFSCSGEEMNVVVPNQDELITTLFVSFTDKQINEVIIWSFTDLDGDGGMPPEITTLPLKSNTDYTMEVIVLNEYAQPPVDITEEVREESDEHQFFYLDSSMLVTYLDHDSQGYPIGLKNEARTTNLLGTHNMRIVLRHQPNKKLSSVQNGDISQAGGETDIDVEFKYTVE